MSVESNELTPLGFIHIPKNAGTSIARLINDNKLPISVSNHWYRRRLSRDEIIVLRCPLDRFKSAFQYGKKYWSNPVNQQFSGANELAESAADPSHPKHDLAWVELGNKPGDIYQRNLKNDPVHSVHRREIDFTFVYEPQSSWMIHNPKHILRFNQLENDFIRLMIKLGFGARFSLQRLNDSDNCNEPDFSLKSLQFLRKIYAQDYALIDSLGLGL